MEFKQTEQFKKYREFVLETFLDNNTLENRSIVEGMFYGFKPFFDAQDCGYLFNDFMGYARSFVQLTPNGMRERLITKRYNEVFDNIGKYFPV